MDALGAARLTAARRRGTTISLRRTRAHNQFIPTIHRRVPGGVHLYGFRMGARGSTHPYHSASELWAGASDSSSNREHSSCASRHADTAALPAPIERAHAPLLTLCVSQPSMLCVLRAPLELCCCCVLLCWPCCPRAHGPASTCTSTGKQHPKPQEHKHEKWMLSLYLLTS